MTDTIQKIEQLATEATNVNIWRWKQWYTTEYSLIKSRSKHEEIELKTNDQTFLFCDVKLRDWWFNINAKLATHKYCTWINTTVA